MPSVAAGSPPFTPGVQMNNRQSRLLEAAATAVSFARLLEKVPRRIIEAAKRLEEAVRAAYTAEQKQLRAKHGRKRPRYSVNRAKTILLRKHLAPIAADGLEMFAGLPGIKDDLRLPRIKDAAQKHLEAAQRVHRVAEEHEEEFIKDRNYDEDFLEKFQKAVGDLEAAAQVERGYARAKYSRATEDVKDEITRVHSAFDALETRMLETYLDDRDTLKRWRQASRIPARRGRPRQRNSDAKRVPRRKPPDPPMDPGPRP